MNSKQIIFFLNPVDLVEIETFLGENKCSFFKRKSENSKRYLNYDIVKNPEKIFQVCLCIEEHKSKLFYEQTQLKEECYIDILKSYCIEFSIGGFYPYNNKELHSSRFYYVLEYFENGKLIQKDREFINWADDLFKRFTPGHR